MREARFDLGAVLLIGALLGVVPGGAGCASAPPAGDLSGIDARFRWARAEARADAETGGDVRGRGMISFHRSALGSATTARCLLYPSDSTQARLLAARCGPIAAAPVVLGRMFDEADAPALGMPALRMGERLLFAKACYDCGCADD